MTNERSWAQWTHMWFCAAERQESRIRDFEGPTPDESEFFLFVDTMRNVLRGALKVLGPGAKEVADFEAAAPDLKNVRDMIEHFDEYIVGQGRMQQTASGLLAPFLVMSTGGGNSHQIVILTHVGGEQRSYVVESDSSLRAAAFLVEAVLTAAGITEVSPRVEAIKARG